MSLREDMWKYEQITGESAEHVPIIKLGAFLDGYEMGLKALEQQPCEDCISRESVRQLIYKNNDKYGYSDRFHEFTEECLQLPSVTPQPKTGRWVEENINEWSRKVFCSECGCPPPFEHVSNGDVYSASGYGVINKTNFCPNCGAKMTESEE